MSSNNLFVYWKYLCFYTVPQGATDNFSDFVGFIVSYRGLCGFLGSIFSLSASFLCTS